MVRGLMLFLVVVGNELVVLLPGVLLQLLASVGDRPLLPLFMGRRLQLVVVEMMLPLLLKLQLLWELRLLSLASTHVLVLLLVLVGIDMRLVVGPLVVLMVLLVLARARLLLHGLVVRLGINGIVDILQAHVDTISGTLHIRGIRNITKYFDIVRMIASIPRHSSWARSSSRWW
jgi:hypothetical protein